MGRICNQHNGLIDWPISDPPGRGRKPATWHPTSAFTLCLILSPLTKWAQKSLSMVDPYPNRPHRRGLSLEQTLPK